MAFSFTDFVGGIPFVGDIARSGGMETSLDQANKDKQKALEKVISDLQAYRPEHIQTRMTALDNAMGLFEPMNKALVSAYGSGAALPLKQASQSPFSDQAMAAMQPAAIKAKEQGKDPRAIQALRKSGWIK